MVGATRGQEQRKCLRVVETGGEEREGEGGREERKEGEGGEEQKKRGEGGRLCHIPSHGILVNRANCDEAYTHQKWAGQSEMG